MLEYSGSVLFTRKKGKSLSIVMCVLKQRVVKTISIIKEAFFLAQDIQFFQVFELVLFKINTKSLKLVPQQAILASDFSYNLQMTIQYIQNAITHSFSFKDELVQLQFLLKLGDLIYFRQSPCLFLFVGLRSTLPPPVMDFPLFGSLSQSKQLIIALSKSVIRRLHP